MLTPNNNNFLLESFKFLFFLKVKKKVSKKKNASKAFLVPNQGENGEN